MIIPQHRNRRPLAGQQRSQRSLPGSGKSRDVDREVLRRAIPVDEQPRLALVFADAVVKERPRRQAVQFDQRIDRGGIDILLVTRPLVEIIAHPRFAEILEQHQTARGILAENIGSAHAIGVEPFRRAQERCRVLVRRRCIHQHRGLLALADAKIAPE